MRRSYSNQCKNKSCVFVYHYRLFVGGLSAFAKGYGVIHHAIARKRAAAGYISKFFANWPYVAIKLRRPSTSSPMRVENQVSASSASSIVTCNTERDFWSIAVSPS